MIGPWKGQKKTAIEKTVCYTQNFQEKGVPHATGRGMARGEAPGWVRRQREKGKL